MGAETGIAWTDHTFNPWWGCVKVSPGCANCYAESWDARWKGGHWGKDAPRRFFPDAHWREPAKWHRAAEMEGRRHRVFCASMADVFEDRRDLDEARSLLWGTILCTPWLDWQLLTKRPENIARLVPAWWMETGFPPHVWIGTTVEDQKRAEERIPHLLKVPAVVRFLSVEPMLGPVRLDVPRPGPDLDNGRICQPWFIQSGIDWVIVGGESGPGARPFALEWARSIVAQCKAASVPVFVKQLGAAPFEHTETETLLWKLRDRKGGDMAAWPADLRVREFPASTGSGEAEGADGGAQAQAVEP